MLLLQQRGCQQISSSPVAHLAPTGAGRTRNWVQKEYLGNDEVTAAIASLQRPIYPETMQGPAVAVSSQRLLLLSSEWRSTS